MILEREGERFVRSHGRERGFFAHQRCHMAR
jgi:hypothetical protein